MIISDIKQTLQWEYLKTKEKGLWTLVGLFIYFLYFYFFPSFLFSLYPSLPYTNLYLMYTIGTYSTHMCAYISINSFYFLIYKLNHPYFESFKVNPGPWPWESPNFSQTLQKLIKCALFNQIITMPVALLIFGLTAKYETSLRMPGPLELTGQIFIFAICEDFCFYCTHRLLHQGFLYKAIHKQHHDFNVTISVAAEYAHPLEYLLGNSLPVALGPLFYGQAKVHLITWFSWVFLRTMNTGEGHSGYNFPWSPFRILPLSSTSTFHDYHHYKNQGNYGSFFVFWDTVLGTHRVYMRKGVKNASKID